MTLVLRAFNFTQVVRMNVKFIDFANLFLQIAREQWAKTLWANLNPQVLLDGMEAFIKDFKRLPKVVRQLRPGILLDIRMKEFKNSIPLFIELKNEALRERHWQELMEKTGIH